MRSTMMPWMLLVLVSRKVNGTPVGVEPTFRTCCADAGIAVADYDKSPTLLTSVRRNTTS